MPSLFCQQNRRRSCKSIMSGGFLFKAHHVNRHYAIGDYLKSQGYDQTLESFMRDCDMVCIKCFFCY